MTHTFKTTPAEDGFRMPWEGEPHRGCWMQWPERPDNWRDGAKPAQVAYAAVAAAIAESEPMTVGVSSEQYQHAVKALSEKVRVVETRTNGAWVRDMGPTFVVDDKGGLRGIDWIFNAWGGFRGGLYDAWDQDQLDALKIIEMERADRYKADLVLEGGAIHVDGEGTLLTTKSVMLNPDRNPKLSQEQIGEKLKAYLNVKKIIWLEEGVYQDETGGHVDNFCVFCAPGEVLLTWTDDKSDPQWEASNDAYEKLSKETDARGRPIKVHKMHQPGPLFMTKEESEGLDQIEGSKPRNAGDRLAGSYVNFYLGNSRVVFPLLDEKTDGDAQKLLQMVFPRRKVVGVPAREILLGGGDIHCITQQVPNPVPR
jgi:agmatine deiminase